MLAGLGIGGAALLAGCKAAVDQSNGPETSGVAGKVARGGTVTMAIPDDLIPANLFTNSNTAITTMIGLVYESLIRYPNDRVVPQPRLATSWQLSADGMTLALDLRRGVRFHSGREFTSKDVAFSIKTYADPKWNGQELSTAQAIRSVDTSQKYRAVLHLAHPMSNIFDVLDTIVIVDSETIDGLATGKKYVGTGPFTFESWTPNSSLVFKRNEHYWQAGRPYVDGVRVNVVPDPTSLLAQIKSGQADLAEGLQFLDAKTLGSQSGFGAIQLVGAEEQIYVGANVHAEPLNDVRVRQAIAYAIDRDRIMSEVFQGSGYSINLPWPKYSSAYDAAKNRTYAYDPDRAKSILKKVGGSLPAIPYTYGTTVPAYGATAQIVQSNLADVGIKVELDPIDATHFVTELIGAQFKGLWTTYHSWAQYTPSTLAVSAYPFNASHNASHYVSSRYSQDANASWVTPHATTAAAVTDYGKVSDDLLQALFLIEIGIVQLQWVTGQGLQGVSYTKRAEIDLTNASFG